MEHLTQACILAAGATAPVLLGLRLAPKLTHALLRDIRLPRILHYVALAGLGLALFIRQDSHIHLLQDPKTWIQFSGLIIALSYAAIFAIVSNNLEDLEGDRISNPNRPLVLGTVEPKPYFWAALFCQAWALGWAAWIGQSAFWGILAISIGYCVYSCRPLRLKRVPILSKLIIGFNSWVVALCGYALAGGNPFDFPWLWSILLLGPLSLAANFVDLKDTEGDRAMRVATLPVLLGEPKARFLIAIATAASYIMAGLLLQIWWAYPLNAAALVVHLFLLYRKPYDERWVFLVYVNALFGLDIFLFFSQNQF